MVAGFGIDQLHVDPKEVATTLHRPFEHIADVQVLADLPHVDSLTRVDFGRISSDYGEISKAREVGDDVLGYAVGEPPRRVVTTKIVEGKERRWTLVLLPDRRVAATRWPLRQAQAR